MPELPEVEQVRRSLAPHILGKKVLTVKVFLPRLVKYPSVADFVGGLLEREIVSVGRRGKYLLLEFNDGQTLVVHLRMTGALIAQASIEAPPEYAKIKFTLTGGVTMWFTDIRTFGTLYLLRQGENYRIDGLETLGPEPLSDEFTAAYLALRAARALKPVKTFLLDQKVIAGLGNIYVDEALFLAGLAPTRQANTLTAAEAGKLVSAINEVIAQGIRNHGTTFRNYRDGEGRYGSNQEHLSVYGRGGEPCEKCGATLAKIKLGGRGTVYCQHCQK